MNEDTKKTRAGGPDIIAIIGYSLVVVSSIIWAVGILVVPFLALDIKTKLAVGGTLVLIGEVMLVAAVPFLGREIVRAMRSKLNPFKWLGRKKTTPANDE